MTKQQLPIETISGTTLVAQNRRQRLYVTEAKTTIGIAIEHTKGTTSMNLSLKEAVDLEDVLRQHIIELTVKQA